MGVPIASPHLYKLDGGALFDWGNFDNIEAVATRAYDLEPEPK